MKESARQLKKERTREAIIEAAYRVFSERGILGARMSDIAAAAGVSHGTVFLHFSTQEELVCEVAQFYCTNIARRTHELAESGGGLREILEAHLDGIAEYEPFYTRLVAENRLLPTAARDAFVTAQSTLSHHFGKAAARVSPLAPELLFNTWLGLIHHYLLNGELFAPGGQVIRRCGPRLVDFFLDLIGSEKM